MSQQPTTREALYERIRNSSKDEVILEEMIRLGFWPEKGELPNDPTEDIRRRGELQRKLDELREKGRRLYNEKALIAEARKLRMAESRRKQKDTKERREGRRIARAQAWAARKAGEALYLGEDVSGGLSRRGAAEVSDPERLARYGLPRLDTIAELAAAMGISVGALRFLAYNRRVSTVTHYRRFRIPKKVGGERLISAPMPRLKQAQHWVLQQVLERVSLHDAAHGFVGGRSIVSNATPHVGADVVINLDLQDFFPTVVMPRVKGLFRSLGYSEPVATALALVCSEPDVTPVELDGVTYFVAASVRHLPQGSPASPAVTNLLCRRLDARLAGLATTLGFAYTRYADDLSFSARGAAAASVSVGKLLRGVRDIVAYEGFIVHPKKTRVMRRGRQQEVTGVVVNDRLAVDRAALRRFRATLYQVEKDGPAGKRWGHGGDLLAALHGYACFVAQVDPAKAQPLLAQVRRIFAKHGKPGGPAGGGAKPKTEAAGQPTPTPTPTPTTTQADPPASTPEPPAKKKPFWKLF